MKLVKEYINEKFVEDSDPIHDLGIGGTIINFGKLREEIKPFYGTENLRKWLNTIKSLRGKTISGKFELNKKQVNKKFVIANYGSYFEGGEITFFDRADCYHIIMENDYFIFFHNEH